MAIPTPKPYTNESIYIGIQAYQQPLFSSAEITRLNKLIGDAAFSERLEYQLVIQRDETLSTVYQISAKTWDYLKQIEAETLQEFCKQVLNLQNTMVNH